MRFSDIIGHHSLKQKLIQEIHSGNIPHAQLFVGKSGHGSLALALAYTRLLLCEKKEHDPCEQCSSCLKTKTWQHVDVHFIFPLVLKEATQSTEWLHHFREQLLESAYFSLEDWSDRTDPNKKQMVIGTKEVESLNKKNALHAFEGGYKVFVLWMVEKMNPQFANKILKTLEEPADKTVFLLVGENPDLLLPTITSRTQQRRVPRVAIDEVIQHLVDQHRLTVSEAQSLAGRYECDLAAIYRQLKEHTSTQFLMEKFVGLMRSCYRKNVLQMIDWAEDMGGQNTLDQIAFLHYALYVIRQCIVKNYTDGVLYQASEEEDAFLKNFSPFITGKNLPRFYERYTESIYHLERNANSKILFTDLCFDTMRFIHQS